MSSGSTAAQARYGDRSNAAANATILVVEDDPDIRALVSLYLVEQGYAVLEASEAESALAVLRAPQSVDLLVTDVVMPGRLDGFSLGEEAVRLRPDLKVLHVTGYAARASERPELEARGQILQKPFNKEQLLERLTRLVGNWSIRRNPLLRRGYDYWLAKAAGRLYPDRADLDPAEIKELLPYLVIIAIEGTPGAPRFRFRLMGEECVLAFGSNATGRYLDEALTGHYRDMIVGLCRDVAEYGRAIYAASSYRFEEKGLSTERLMLPFSMGSRDVRQIVVVQTFDWKPRAVSVHRLLHEAAHCGDRIELLPAAARTE